MRILTCVKHVPDTTEVRFDPSTGELKIRQAPTKINNYDEHALEAAAVLRESTGAEVLVACVGPTEAAKTVKAAVAMGADRGVLVSGAWAAEIDPMGVATVLRGVVATYGPFDLILAGDVSEDGYNSLVPGILAQGLDVPFVRGIIELDVDGASARATRVADDVVETYAVELPAVLSVSSGLNQPRAVTTLQIMKVAMSKIVTVSAGDVGLDDAALSSAEAATRIEQIRPAAVPRRREMVTGEVDEVVATLVSRFRAAGVVA